MSNFKNRLKNGETLLGTWNTLPSASVSNALACSGIDFAVVDMEHGPFDFETAENMVRALQSLNKAAIIRVPTNEPYLILKALDIGADGVQVPHVSTKEDAVNVIKSSKYFPLGERGLTPYTRAGYYGLKSDNHVEQANDNSVVVLNVEGTEGISNLSDIATVDYIDTVFIGPYDLSQSIGKPGNIKDSDVIARIKESVSILGEKGIACGSFAGDDEMLDILIDCGVRYITYGVDAGILTTAFNDLYHRFKEKVNQ